MHIGGHPLEPELEEALDDPELEPELPDDDADADDDDDDDVQGPTSIW